MNKKLKPILIITSILIFLLLINRKSIQQGYRAFSYRNVPYFLDLAKKGGTDKYEIIKLVKDNLSMYYDSTAQTIIFFNGIGGIWKLDRKGSILDSLIGDDKFMEDKFDDGMLWSSSFGGGVSYWILNGDTAGYKTTYLQLSDSAHKNFSKYASMVNTMYNNSDRYYHCNQTVVFHVKNKWYIIDRYKGENLEYDDTTYKYPEKQGPKRITDPFGLAGYDYPWKGTKDSTIAYLVTDVFTSSSRTTGSDFNQGVFVEELTLPGETIRFKVRGDAMDNGHILRSFQHQKTALYLQT